MMSSQFHFSCALFLLLLFQTSALNIDGSLLLSFKYSVLLDPLSVLDNWVYTDDGPCSWTGVKCAPVGSPAVFRVVGIVLPDSQLLGSIPVDLGLIQHLRTVDLSGNFLNGTLPGSLFNATELQVLSLSNNKIFGELPELNGGVSGLQVLNLSDNALAGKLPENLTNFRNLKIVSLRSNYFSGIIPSGFSFVETLDLSSNLLNGSLPENFGGEKLRSLNLSYNKLSGSVPSEFAGKIPENATIDLSFNNLSGEIPQSLPLVNQKTESFAGNADLCGKPLKQPCTIASTFSVPPNVTTTESSPAIAAMPRPIGSTPGADSASTQNGLQSKEQSKLKPGTIAGIAVADIAGIGILAMVFLYVYQLRKKKNYNHDEIKAAVNTIEQSHFYKEDPSKESKGYATWSCLNLTNGEDTSATASDSDENGSGNGSSDMVETEKREKLLVMVDGETQLEVETLLKASAYILGSSGSSIVYKAVLEDGTEFAVRRIGEGGVGRLREFESHVRALAKLRHPNIVRVRGFYWGEDEKLVINDYVSNGSLAVAGSTGGYKKMGSSPCHLSFKSRLKIARGLAKGLTYIHDKKQVHGNIKPNNILLTLDMDAVIADLGVDRLVSANHHRSGMAVRHWGSKRSASGSQDLSTGIASPYSVPPASFVGCTSAYHAPESLENLKPNPKWDVYSFGIILLELLTGRVFSDRELSQWTGGSSVEEKNRVLKMADVAMRADVECREEAMLACFKLGFSCASLVPQKRPSMKEAIGVLEKLPY